ncbi:MAG: 4Fe-4S binding protein [bacterium]
MIDMLSSAIELMGLFFPAFFVLHLFSAEESRGRRLLLKVFARWIEVPLLRLIYEACQGRLSFLTRTTFRRKVLGVFFTRPFGLYMDTGIPVPAREAVRLIQALEGPVAVGDCRCRLAKKTCEHPMRTDIVFRTGAEAWLWAFPDNYHEIDRNEAIKIVEDCAGQGMFPMIFVHCSSASRVNEYVLCNCCTCGCKVHLLNRTVGQEYFPLPDGGFRSFLDEDKCDGCGECVSACPFDAIHPWGGKVRIRDCYGCGVCERVCLHGALALRRVNQGPPWSQPIWREPAKEEEHS